MTSNTLELPRASSVVLSTSEQLSLGLRLTLSLFAGGCLIVAAIVRFAEPTQGDVAQLVVGIAALLVSVPTVIAAWRSLQNPSLNGVLDQLIALAVVAAWASGDLIIAAVLPLVMTLGHILEERSLLGSREAIHALTRLTDTKARRIHPSGEIEEISANLLEVGNQIELRAGDQVPGDGTVVRGRSSVDTASITGESVPLEVQPGDEVFNGSLNIDGHLIVRITRVGEQTTLGRVVSLLHDAELAKPPVTRLLEQYSQRYLLLVLLIAAGAWFVTENTGILLAVLVASCPCALVLAAPATSIAAISVASRHGILVKGSAFLESLATVDAVAFDKTGTITIGRLQVVEVRPEPGVGRQKLLELAGSLAAASSHPVSQALASVVPESSRLPITDIKETRGLGVVGLEDGEIVAFGRDALFRELNIVTSPPPEHDGPIAGLSREKKFLGWVFLADEARPEAKTAVLDLRELGLERQLLITGDRAPAANRIAAAVGIPNVYAGLLPAEKMERVQQEVASGYRPLVVGDGINDALALKAGAVGIAMGGQGTDVALASADLVLMTNDLRRLGTCIRLSRRCRRTIYTNITIGIVWTVATLAVALTGSLGANGALLAAIFQNASSVLVMMNAGRLLKFQETLS